MNPYRKPAKTVSIKLSPVTRVLTHRTAPALVIIVVPILGSIILYGTGILGSAIMHEHYSHVKTVVFGLVMWLVGVLVGCCGWLFTVGLYRIVEESIALHVIKRISEQELELLTLQQLENLQKHCEDHDVRLKIAAATLKKRTYTCTPTGVPKEQ